MSPQKSEARASTVDSPLADQEDEPPLQRVEGLEHSTDTVLKVLPHAVTAQDPPVGQHARALVDDDTTRRQQSEHVKRFRKLHFPGVTTKEWNDWHWQAKNRIRHLEQLERHLRLVSEEREAFRGGGTFLPFAISPYYLALLDPEDSRQGLRRSVIPSVNEFVRMPGEFDDPLAEDSQAVAPGLIHRYPDRVLFLTVDYCTTYCRYCTRSRVVGSNELTAKTERWEQALQYIRSHTAIRDVLLSGGDPLSLADDRLDWLLGELRKIRHVEFLRIGTKMPAVLPQRITTNLTRILKKHHPLWMSLHFIHPDECTPEASLACARLADAGIPLGSQSVLLKGINDDLATLKLLMHRLLMMRVRPYYLYQCDPIAGSHHFRTSVERGLSLIDGLRGHTSGYAVPTYVIDAPGGGGKIPLQADYVVGHENGDVILRNFQGQYYRYTDCPQGPVCDPPSIESRRHLRTVS
jgi:lysine 2,3-aminomutase